MIKTPKILAVKKNCNALKFLEIFSMNIDYVLLNPKICVFGFMY
jgi:hypothetical protein